MKYDYVIVGCSTAGIAAAEAIRKVDPAGKLAMITEEDRPAYGRPLISYYLQGVVDKSKLSYRPEGFYRDNRIDLMTGVRAETLDPAKHALRLSDGRTAEYKKLLVATGSTPFVPPAEGLDSVAEQLCFYTAADAEKLKSLLTPHSRLLIVGAGLIGLKCMEGAYEITKNITVVDLAPRVLSSALDDECAALVQKKIEEKGVRVILSDSVKRYEKNSCVLSSGERLDFDVVVMAVGVRPNVSLIADAGGKINRGIVTDDTQLTSLPDVYAAGDCTVSRDISSGAEKVIAVLPNAYLQGETAGYNMAGEKHFVPALTPLNSIGFFGVHVLSAGSYDGEVIERRGEGYLKRFFVKDDRLKGFVLVNSYARAGILLSLIREDRPISEVDFDAMTREPGLIDFDRETRREKLDR